MSDPLTLFNKRVESAVRRQDGISLRELLRLRSIEATKAMEVYIAKGGSLPAPMPDSWSVLPDIVEKRFAAGGALNFNDCVSCNEHLSECLSSYISALQSESAWSIPLLHALCSDMRVVAEQADQQLCTEGKKPCKLEEAEQILKRAFMTTNNDRR